jgi:hypothetical protein
MPTEAVYYIGKHLQKWTGASSGREPKNTCHLPDWVTVLAVCLTNTKAFLNRSLKTQCFISQAGASLNNRY